MNAQATVERFFDAFYSGDGGAAREVIAEDFTLVGSFATAHSADEFISLAKGLLKVIRGHRVLRWVIDGNDVAALYEIVLKGPAGQGSLTTGGWSTVADGRVPAASWSTTPRPG